MNEKPVSSLISNARSETQQHKAALTNAGKSWGKLLSCAGLAMVVGATSATAQSSRDSWYFSAVEIGAAYQYQENYGGRIGNPLPAFGCMTGKADFAASYRGVPVRVPCQFINEVMRHLKDMLDIGAARYLFPLDADHAHLAVPADVWAAKYSKFSSAQLPVALLRESKLVALYHTAEHLETGAGDGATDDDGVKRWKKQRNVLGFFDGRPLHVLPPHPKGFGVGMPDGLASYGGFNFLASPRGELMILQGQRAIAFDVSLETEDFNPAGFDRSLTRSVPRR
jgi:hypothetical protein